MDLTYEDVTPGLGALELTADLTGFKNVHPSKHFYDGIRRAKTLAYCRRLSAQARVAAGAHAPTFRYLLASGSSMSAPSLTGF